jgi:glutamyl/glutaminyl-tRNA synthetase
MGVGALPWDLGFGFWDLEFDAITRFAPSPTGYLHLGHVVNAIYVWGVARVRGARVLLRVEDHDRIRSRPEYDAALLEDLDWLGFIPDAGRSPVVRQSDRSAIYDQALQRLRRTHHVYACECSRRTARLRHGGGAAGGERYDGRCRDRGLEEAPGRTLRVRIGAGVERFTDLRLGPLEQLPDEQCGDLAIKDRDGHWTYQFAVTVDDFDQRVTLVIRGEDLVSSTGRQIRLARMLGRADTPQFLHHPLIFGASGEKLSKSAADSGVRELREAGLSAADVIGRAAAAVGLIGRPTAVAAVDVAELMADYGV